jgi:hypothetical protein
LPAATVLMRDATTCVGSIGNVVCSVTRTSFTEQHMDHISDLIMRSHADHPKGIVHLTIVDATGVSIPTAGQREKMTEHVRMLGPKTRAQALVLSQQGFVGATVRSIASGIFFAARIDHPCQAFADAGSAVAWLGPHLEQTNSAEVLFAVGTFRAVPEI